LERINLSATFVATKLRTWLVFGNIREVTPVRNSSSAILVAMLAVNAAGSKLTGNERLFANGNPDY